MRRIFSLAIAVLTAIVAQAQMSVDLIDFDKLQVGPRIEAHLVQGTNSAVDLTFHKIDEDAIRIKQKNGKVHIYLEHAKNVEKQRKMYDKGRKYKTDWYHNGHVVAVITYTDLSKLVIKGEEDIQIDGSISDDLFKMKVFGDTDIQIANIQAERVKVKMYGDSDIVIQDGAIGKQKYVLFGENSIEADKVHSEKVKATMFGENFLDLNSERLKFTAFGETEITCGPNTDVRKGIVLGESDINRY